jgi:hypothetical protein
MEMNRVLRCAIVRGQIVAVATELPQVEGNVRARRLAFVVRPDRFSGFRTSRRSP